MKGKGDVSEYFKEFLGCDTTIQERKDTLDLVAALKEFAEAQRMDSAVKDSFLNKAKFICERSAKLGQELEFSALANELVDLMVERWPNLWEQLWQGAADIFWTLALPSVAVFLTRPQKSLLYAKTNAAQRSA